jgi:NDP-sugar pyrophosphorylase family protein
VACPDYQAFHQALSQVKNLYGVIPAAGMGVRAWPESLTTPKSLFEINGIPVLQRNIEIMRDQMGIREIVIVTGHLGFMIEDYLRDGSRWGVQLYFVRNRHIDRGLAWSIFLGRKFVDDYFCVILGDECYLGSNHHQLVSVAYQRALATCGVKKESTSVLIKENYGVTIGRDGSICRLIEKPVTPENNLLGCGTFVLSPAIFPLLEKAYEQKEYSTDFISLLNTFCQQGHTLMPFWLEGSYVNINDQNGILLATLQDTLFHSTQEE